MRKLSKTLLSLLLIAAMLASFVVLPAAAEEPAAEQPTEAVQAAETQADDAEKSNYELSIVMLDCGRKYFSVDSIKQIIDNAAAAGFNNVMLAVGNDGMRFLLDDMSLTVNGTTYSSEEVAAAIHTGNEAYYNFTTDELTESEMDEIIAYAKTKGLGIIPVINTPGHMDAILDAAEALTGKTCSYNGSARTIDVTNSTAVAFTQAFVQKYVDYFASKGCQYFNMGADEYANDKYTGGSMGFGNLQNTGKYSYYVKYVNAVAALIKNAGMTPMAFNDGIYFANNTSSGTFDTDIVICYWSNGWSSYTPMPAETLASMGFKMVNTHGDHYWVLGKSDWQCNAKKASSFNYKTFQGGTIDNPSGAMFCIWADYPGAETEASVISKTADTIAAFGATLPKIDDNKTVSDEATGVSVTAPGLTGITVAAVDKGTELDGKKVAGAWNIELTTANGSYTDSATVSIPVGKEWLSYKLTGGVLESDGTTVTSDPNSKVENGVLTFTAPHFSTVVVLAEEKQQEITVTVGGTVTLDPVDGEFSGDYTNDYVTVKTDIKQKNQTYVSAKLTDDTLYVSTKQNDTTPTQYLKFISAGNGKYYIQDGDNYIYPYAARRIFDNWDYSLKETTKQSDALVNVAINSDESIMVSRDYSETSSWGTTYTAKAYLTISGSSYAATDTETYLYLYDVGPVSKETTISFTGKKAGTTRVKIGDVLYIITVSPENLDNVSPLKIEFWITNKHVYDGTTYSSSLPTSKDIAAANVHFEEGVLLESLVPATGVNSDSNPMVFWKSTRLASDNKQTTGSGVDKTRSGSDFTYIRYWNGSWSYSADGVNWVNAETGDQFVAYYLQKTEVTKEVETQVVDWGPQRDNWSSLNYLGTKYVLMDYAVKYESGEQVPSTFPTADTLAFHCDTSTTKNNIYYREIGMIRAKETDEYEVYMITLTPTSDTPTDTLKGSTAAGNNSYEYKGTETVVWADTQEDLDASGLGTYTSISGAFTYSIGGEPIVPGVEIYRKQAMKVTYYVRAKVTEDSLTVHYIDKTANQEFYSYNIAVAQGTYFNANIGLNKDAWKGPLVNGEVTNLKGNIQTVSADLSMLPALSAQYRYSDYTCVEVTRSTGNTETGTPAGKEVYLYYTFNNKHTFVVDFGVPLKIKATDIGVTVPEGDSYWTEATCTGAVYGETKIANGEGLTYTATKPMLGIETLNVTLATGTGEDDKATHTIYLVPATTVYYEQNVATYSDGWSLNGTAIAADKYQETQKGRTPGYNFGYDLYYEQNQLGANGSVMYTTTPGESAQLTFKGTGMELYLRTQNANATSDPATEANNATDHSYMLVQVYAGDTADANNLKRMSFVDVNNLFVAHGSDKYGYNTPCWTVDGMTYGTYTVVVRYVKGTTYGLAIDGFRVTNTLNPDNATTKDFYAAVHEDNMQTSEIRNMVLAQANVSNAIFGMSAPMYQVGVKEVLDAVFDDKDVIDGASIISKLEDGTTTVTVDKDLVNIGPKNEIYLQPGQAVVMELTGTYASVQVGMRSLTGAAVTYQINSGEEQTMNSTVDMYYKVNLVDKKLVIQNTSKNKEILALTKLKVTSKSAATGNDSAVIPQTTPEAIRYAMALMRGIDVPQFTDVAEDAWYHDYVYDLVYRGVVNGMTATTYEPEGKLTRAQFVKLLACSLEEAETLKTYEGQHPFTDSEGHWAETYIAWAKDKGIVEGVSATEFDPEAPITREQMATIFGRYALKQGIELPKDAAPAQSFPDADKISEYAREFVELMRIAGILNGYEDGTFRPQGNATRAEAAKLFSLFLSITDKLAK